MNEEEGFRAAIRADADDGNAWAAYRDWLEDRDDVRRDAVDIVRSPGVHIDSDPGEEFDGCMLWSSLSFRIDYTTCYRWWDKTPGEIDPTTVIGEAGGKLYASRGEALLALLDGFALLSKRDRKMLVVKGVA